MFIFKPRYLKRAKLLRKGVVKFLSYKKDLISEKLFSEITAALEDFDGAVESRDKERIKLAAKELTKLCEQSVPPPSNPIIRENLEVILVAIIIAVGIRTYCVQPFRIPTGSMQPTLNGIICKVIEPSENPNYAKPGPVKLMWEKFSEGRTYVDIKIPAGAKIDKFEEVTKFKFFTSTLISFEGSQYETIKVGVPLKNLFQEKNRGGLGLRSALNISRAFNYSRESAKEFPVKGRHMAIDSDFRLQGYCDTGDQVLVNKMIYHFRSPERGEIFVFNTKGIAGINGGVQSQHYIKRLCGVPGDSLEIKKNGGPLYVNGEIAKEDGIAKVFDEYDGYSLIRKVRVPDYQGINKTKLPKDSYFALGDNSDDSADSRMWGNVPEDNLLGPGLMVYWPLEHWGLMK